MKTAKLLKPSSRNIAETSPYPWVTSAAICQMEWKLSSDHLWVVYENGDVARSKQYQRDYISSHFLKQQA